MRSKKLEDSGYEIGLYGLTVWESLRCLTESLRGYACTHALPRCPLKLTLTLTLKLSQVSLLGLGLGLGLGLSLGLGLGWGLGLGLGFVLVVYSTGQR